MRDVAQKAHVSVRTVSRVVNGQGEITQATRERVLATIAELGYRPSKVARALVTQRSETIGLIVNDIANPFFAEVAHATQQAARAAGYDVFFYNSDGSWEEELRALHSMADHGVDGILIAPSPGLTAERIKPFADRFAPIVTLVYAIAHPNTSAVLSEIRQGARQAVTYLIDRGHTRIAMLAGPAANPLLHWRVQGYRAALLKRGLPYRAEWIFSGPPTFERGRASTHALLKQYPETTAIFAYNDLLALGAIRACRELGRRVPDDCAIIGFDDISMADLVSPALTTVRVDKRALGGRAMARILEMLAAPGQAFQPIFLPTELIRRESA
jgi:LacI family transcriptional regulator